MRVEIDLGQHKVFSLPEDVARHLTDACYNRRMKVPPIDLTYIAQRFEECAKDLEATWSDSEGQESQWTTPELAGGMRR